MSDATVPHGTEQILAMIPNVTLKAGLLGMKSRLHILVLTNHRIIFVRETTAQLKQVSAELRAQARAQGQGRMGQLGAQSTAHDVLAQTYAAMNPAAILVNDPHNFAVDRSTVTTVKTKTVDPTDGPSEDRLSIKTTGKNYKFIVNGSLGQAREALEAAGFALD